jgi:hypothetical protein
VKVKVRVKVKEGKEKASLSKRSQLFQEARL